MKRLFFLLLCSSWSFAQVIIDGETLSSPSVSLDFGTSHEGMVLPWISDINTMNQPVAGTMILNVADKKVQVKLNNMWLDLSPKGSTPINDYIQENLPESNYKTVIGAENSSVNGVLILEENNKAMRLPQATNPHIDIKNPAPGLIVYDSKKKMLCVFNGSTWSFWRQRH